VYSVVLSHQPFIARIVIFFDTFFVPIRPLNSNFWLFSMKVIVSLVGQTY